MMEIRRKRLPPTTFLGVRRTLPAAEVPAFVIRTIDTVFLASQSAGLRIVGPLNLRYFGMGEDIAKPLKVEVSLPISPSTETVPDLPSPIKVRRATTFECISIEYVGPMPGIGQAWEDALAEARESGDVLTGTGREIYHRWVGIDAPDNRIEILVGVRRPDEPRP